MKLGTKIAGGFGLMLTLTMILGAVTIVNMRKVDTLSDALAAEHVPEVRIAGELERAAQSAMLHMTEYGLTESTPSLVKGREHLAEVAAKLDEAAALAAGAENLVVLRKQVGEARAVYDRFVTSLGEMACRKFCAACCSRNVTMTTLEGLHFLNGLAADGRAPELAALTRGPRDQGFRPRWTTNQMAAFCREGREPPEDAVDHDDSRCPFLADDACALYGLRPFGCRCMVSRQPCGARGYADVDDWILTVNTVFLQTIEHIDRPGCFGNLQDVLLALAPEAQRAAYAAGKPPADAPGLIPNHPAPMLLVPPEHRARMAPILAEIQRGMEG